MGRELCYESWGNGVLVRWWHTLYGEPFVSSVLRRSTTVALCILPLLWALAPIGALRAADCPSSAVAVGGRVDPSACVAYGTHVALQVTAFAPGQLRSLVLRGPGGLVSGADRSLRVDRTGRLVLDTTNYLTLNELLVLLRRNPAQSQYRDELSAWPRWRMVAW